MLGERESEREREREREWERERVRVISPKEWSVVSDNKMTAWQTHCL